MPNATDVVDYTKLKAAPVEDLARTRETKPIPEGAVRLIAASYDGKTALELPVTTELAAKVVIRDLRKAAEAANRTVRINVIDGTTIRFQAVDKIVVERTPEQIAATAAKRAATLAAKASA